MSVELNNRVGWKLREAVRRTVDPDVLADYMAATRDRLRGSPRALEYFSQELNGAGADPALRQIPDLASRQRRSASDLENMFRQYLTSGRLIAWGRRESPVADL